MYNWTIEDIQKDIDYLDEKARKEKDLFKKDKLYQFLENAIYILLQLHLNDIDDIIEDTDIKSFENLIEYYELVPKFELYYPFIEQFVKLLKPVISKYNIYNNNIDSQSLSVFSYNHLMELCKTFYQSTDDEFTNYFEKLYSTNNHIRFKVNNLDITDSCVYNVFGLKKSYINIDHYFNENYTEILGSIVHEEAHAISFLINENRYWGNAIFCEIEAIFFELIANDFFTEQLDNNNFMIQSLNRLINEYYNGINLLKVKELIHSININKISPNLSLKFEYVGDISELVSYVFSCIVAIELCEIYHNDKKEALTILKKIINLKNDESEYANILFLIEPNKSLKSYIKRITNDIKLS